MQDQKVGIQKQTKTKNWKQGDQLYNNPDLRERSVWQ